MKSCSVTIQMKATEQCFPMVLFVVLYRVVPKFESVEEILTCEERLSGAILYFGHLFKT